MLSDVAEIRDTLEKATMDERANGQRSVRVMIQKQSGANTVDIVHEIQKRLPDIQASLPRDVKMETIFEGSQEITNAIGSLSDTIMYAFIFVVLGVMAFLGRWRATLIICMTIPVSLICSFIYLFATGSTLNIISLSSLSIAIGMVVAAAIVVLDKILNQKDPLHVEEVEFPEEAEKDAEEAEKTAEAYAEAEAKEEAKAADTAAEEAAPEAPAPAENAPQTQPETAEERPEYDPDTPNANPVEAGPAVAPKDENGKIDVTKIADANDFGDWEEQGCKG